MNFLEKIFKKTPSEKTNVPEAELASFLENEFSQRMQAFNQAINEKLNTARLSLDELKQELARMSEQEISLEEGNARLRQAVKTSKKELLEKFNALTGKLAMPESIDAGKDFSEFKKLVLDSLNELNKSVLWFRKNIAYTSIVFSKEIKSLGRVINGLNDALIELNKQCNEPEINAFFHLRQRIHALNESINLLEKNKALYAEKENALNSINFALAEKQKGLAELKSSKAFNEFNELLARKEALNASIALKADEARIIFSSIARQLEKFNKLVQSNKYLIEKQKAELLNIYSTDFLKACNNDKGLQALNSLVRESIEALKAGKLHLKPGDFNKKLAALKGFDSRKLEARVNDLNALKEELNESSKKISESGITEKINGLSNEANSLAADAKQAGIEAGSLKESILALEKKRIQERALIESELKKLFKKEITISQIL